MASEYTATSLREFIKTIERIREDWTTRNADAPNFWFRGHQKSCWSLVPKLYRPHQSARALLKLEDEIREEFARRAPSLTSYRPANAWEWYFLMQHYSAPTRLLDWTEDPLIGLLFALKDNLGFHNSAVWVLDPWQLNDIVLGESEVIPPGSDGLSAADVDKYKPWLPDRFDAKQRLQKEMPIAIFPNQFDRRIAAQKSCFTVHGRRVESLDRLFARKKRLLAKIVIPAYAAEGVRSGLDYFGIDEVTIYPDLEGLGQCVARFLPTEIRVPHDKLHARLRPSSIDGVGVFAISRIKRGTVIFSGDLDEMLWVGPADLPKERSLAKFYEDFAVWKLNKKRKPKRYGCPVHFDRLTMSWYLNDPKPGESPNVGCDERLDFFALRDIKRGEELTVDSSTYSDHPKPKVKKSASSPTSRKGK